jgi:NAD(P)-dependent dehydrogenase (short-subunit alcohol dehydrogenase family)
VVNKLAFVTGGTGLIGRAVVERLLERGLDVTLMVRGASMSRRGDVLDALRAAARGRLTVVDGDLTKPGLGLDEDGVDALSRAAHCFHIGALYDISADEEALHTANEEGTKALLSVLEKAGFDGRLHFVSSVAVAGDFDGTFREDMFEEGQSFEHAYHQTKYAAEKLIRDSKLNARIYRPSSVVGDSKTGAIDRLDGVYFSFPAIQKLSRTLPRWVRLPVPRIRGAFNLVPVDYVADALVHIALSETHHRVFHLVDPKPPSLTKMSAIFLEAAGGPRLGPALKLDALGQRAGGARALLKLPSVVELREAFLRDLGFPDGALDVLNVRVRFDDSHTQEALEGSGIECPPLRTYAKTLYRYYEDRLAPNVQREARREATFHGKVVLVTGASRGVGRAVALQAGAAGATVLLVARGAEKLEEAALAIRDAGGEAYALPTDLSSYDEVDALAVAVLRDHGGVDVLVHNAAHSIRRPASLSVDRFHDYERLMRLNYFAPVRLTLHLLESLRARGGSISHVLTQGVLIPTPFFPAYTASKSALDAFADALAGELQHEGLRVSSVYLPLVKTEMIGPTADYAGRKNVMTPERAASMILDGIVEGKRRIMPPGTKYLLFGNRVLPATTTRILNILQRAFPVGDEPSEFPAERAVITSLIGGSPI